MDLSKMTARARHYVTADGRVDGASSGSSKYKQPDWGADTEIVDILSETTAEVNADEGAALIMEPLSYMPIGDKTYEINYNGTSYSCPCLVSTGDYGPDYAFGNLHDAGMPDAPATGEPFVLVCYGETTAANQGFYGMIMPLDGSTTVTVSVKGEAEKIYVIPKKYVEQVPVPPLIINVTDVVIANGLLIVDTALADIMNAVTSGRTVYFWYGDTLYPVLRVERGNDRIIFGSIYEATGGSVELDMFNISVTVEHVTVAQRERYTVTATAWAG